MEQIAADEQANSVLSDEILELFDKISEHQQAVVVAEAGLEKGKASQAAIRARVDAERDSLESDLCGC